MVNQHPEILKGIELDSVKLVSSEYQEIKKPVPNSKGHIKYSFNLKPQFKKKPEDEHPYRMIQNAEITIKAFLGEEPTDGSAPDELSSCRIKFLLFYKINKPSFIEQDYLQYQWFFQSHATLLARGYIRDILKDTDFFGMPVPFEVKGETN
ncbi:MAG TPA: hypothetical protein PL039_01605 [Kiritimatiellia bacterium]|jgi:hypothetical protein|nr:hypothetical protein [Lentisphaerota bacterium]HPC18876.1 hypothetical protein [Kiritimatiellia bacterium]